MTLNLYVNKSEANRKTKVLESQLPMVGTLREECNITNPAIVVETTVNMSTYNYAYIPDFSRYYFITEVTSVRENIWRLSLKCDVLSTAAPELDKLSAIIQRQENNWNLYLNDGFFRTFQNPQFQVKKFPLGFTAPESYTWVLVTS